MMKYRIKEYEALVTRHKRSLITGKLEVSSEDTVKRYQIEMRLKGFWGRLWGWSEIGLYIDTEEEARQRVANYQRAEGRRENGVRYINL